jgi:hypothetical protein
VGVKLPKSRVRDTFVDVAYTIAQVDRMHEDTQHRDAVDVIHVLSWTGLRQSECRGLRNFHNLENRKVKPALEKSRKAKDNGVEWRGFHGFRRGLGSNLFRLGVNPVVIQALRRGDLETTKMYYMKTPGAEAHAALQKLEGPISSESSGVSIAGKEL